MAEYEIHCNDEFVASVGGPKERAWAEAMHYVAQYRADGEVRVYEVTRRLCSYPIEGEEGYEAVPQDSPCESPPLQGPWRANTSEDGSKVWIDSDDFEHDVRLVVSGDFESSLSKYLYARALAERMNQMPTTGTDCALVEAK